MSSIWGVALALQAAAAYDCTVQPPRSVSGEPGQEQVQPVGVPGSGGWRFQIDLRPQRGGATVAEVVWSGDPIQVAGHFPVLPTGPGALVFAAVSGGPCLFTEQTCVTLVNLVDMSATQARVVLTPSAITQFGDGHHEPFVVILTGAGTRRETSR